LQLACIDKAPLEFQQDLEEQSGDKTSHLLPNINGAFSGCARTWKRSRPTYKDQTHYPSVASAVAHLPARPRPAAERRRKEHDERLYLPQRASQQGYAMFTWDSIGIIDQPSMLAITHEAWLRNPTTIVKLARRWPHQKHCAPVLPENHICT